MCVRILRLCLFVLLNPLIMLNPFKDYSTIKWGGDMLSSSLWNFEKKLNLFVCAGLHFQCHRLGSTPSQAIQLSKGGWGNV